MGLFEDVFSGVGRRTSPTVQGSKETRERLDELEQRVGELALLSRALMVALAEKGAISDARLREIMDKIDAEDGVVDGQVTSYRGQKKAAAAKAKAAGKKSKAAE